MRIECDFYGDDDIAQQFYVLQEKVFSSLDLRWACANGYILPNTVPFGLFEDGRAVSILNATMMEVVTGRMATRAVQLGTVATDPNRCNQGYSATLIKHVLHHYSGLPFFLFANETVLDFYPRFGFRPVTEYLFHTSLRPGGGAKFIKLDPANQDDARIIRESFDNRTELSHEFGIANYGNLAKWYCHSFYNDSIWHDRSGTLLVAHLDGTDLIVHDVVRSEPDSRFFLNLSWPGADRAVCHFVPDRFDGDFIARPDDSALFTMRGFPGHPTQKIPSLAHT